jgi:hypothetical protein
MPECITVALMFVCNGIGIYVAHKLFSWFENQPAVLQHQEKPTYRM